MGMELSQRADGHPLDAFAQAAERRMIMAKFRKKPVVIEAFRLNERGLIGEDWFWDAVTRNDIITHCFGKHEPDPAWYENRCTWDYCSNGGTTETAEPQPDSIQFRTVDDLGRICLPKDIRDKLGIKPGTECAVYSTDELTPYEIIAIRRK